MAIWACPGCGAACSDTDPDLITGHVAGCDYTDGAGQEHDVTLKWSVTWYITTVSSSRLARAASARPFTSLTGRRLDPDDDDPDA
jgi:hypothetical protein